jgi:acyl-CoA thioester hydrolase
VAVFNFFHPIEVRYGDLDPQGHVNNAKYLTYCEHARISYLSHLGLWKGGSFLDIGIILADVKITFHAPILFGQKVQIGVRTTRMGNKSLTVEHCIEQVPDSQTYADSTVILVAYDYHQQSTIPIPKGWRKTIAEFERLPPDATK